MVEFEARVVAAALKILGMSSIDSTPVTMKIPPSIEAGDSWENLFVQGGKSYQILLYVPTQKPLKL